MTGLRKVTVLVALLPMGVTAWISVRPRRSARHELAWPRVFTATNNNNNDDYHDDDNRSMWSVTDDWEALSAAEDAPVAGWQVFGQDVLARAAQRMEEQFSDSQSSWLSSTTTTNEEDMWLEDSLNEYLGHSEPAVVDKNKEDTDSSPSSYQRQEDEATAVARLVRCQEPLRLTTSRGSTVALDDRWEVLYDVHQLLQYNSNATAKSTTTTWEATPFLQNAIHRLFQMHAPNGDENTSQDEKDWDAASVAAWLRQSLDTPCGPHDARVTRVIALFGRNGHLRSDGLVRLYIQALLQDEQGVKSTSSNGLSPSHVERTLGRIQTQPALRAVWKDLERHGIHPPAVVELNKIRQQATRQQATTLTATMQSGSMMDECEILDDATPNGWYQDEDTGAWERHGKSSHEKVRLASDGKTPLFLEDGEFIYIDEESCIGCTQCVLASPGSFQMLENGRARTHEQRGRLPDVQAAVQTCPVNCMHFVDFARLTKLEQARDSINGDDGRSDHRHFGLDHRHGKWRPHTPLFVSRMESSDANHKDSLYHHVRRQCYRSHDCPSKGCYDCPLHASNPDANPQHIARLKEHRHIRAQTFLQDGTADPYRRTAEL